MSLLATLLLAAVVEASPRYEIALEEVLIPMRDGVSLAADLWRPEGAKPGARFPVVLEYLPYRKDEERASYCSLYSYLVRRGYVVAQVDIRGTSRSDGILVPYEYSEIEHRDGDDLIAWLARQPLSSGNVGMIGISSERLATRSRSRREATSGYVEIESIDRNPQRRSTRVVATNDNTSRYPWGEHRIVERVVHEVEDARPEAASVRRHYEPR